MHHSFRQKSQHSEHTLHDLTLKTTNHKYKKQTIYYNNNNYTTNDDTNAIDTTEQSITQNTKLPLSSILAEQQNTVTPNKVLNLHFLPMCKSEKPLPQNTRRLLAQLEANKQPFRHAYINKISRETLPSPLCPLCSWQQHGTAHLFNCSYIPTPLGPESLRVRLRRYSRVGGESWIVCREMVRSWRPTWTESRVDTNQRFLQLCEVSTLVKTMGNYSRQRRYLFSKILA